MGLILAIGLFFSPLAALATYFITYDEAEHHYSSHKEPRKLAIEAAIFTFIIFMVLSLMIGFLLQIYL